MSSRSSGQVKHPLAACLLVASLGGLAILAVRSHPADPPLPDPPVGNVELEPVAPLDRESFRIEFFEREVAPQIAETDQRNREAADRCVRRLEQLMDQYREGVNPFVEDLTSISTRLGIVRRMPADWWNRDGRVESYVQAKFEKHLFSETTLTGDVGEILEGFRRDVDANQKRMLVNIRACLDTADLPEIRIDDYGAFLSSVADQLQRYSSQQGSTSVHHGLMVLVISEAGSYASLSVVSALLTRFGTAAATTAVAAGGATAGASAAGAGGGSLGGPVGTAVGLGVGLVIGLTIDWWMTEKFEQQLRQTMHQYVDSLEEAILHGTQPRPLASEAVSPQQQRGGIGDGLPVVCDRLRDAYQQRFREQIIQLEPSP